jgi:hypothetical protein
MGNKKRELDGKTKASLVKNFFLFFLFLLVYYALCLCAAAGMDEVFFGECGLHVTFAELLDGKCNKDP